ncbi:NADH-quinone oxidoreductase subunit K [Altererythrobacter sp. KTW20L]|uniref:NADH-quinone oxidoreductase subunit K n=1 Tax=Altererythrobacter sp. KTW20L TaxID=2942210 RepID=UPI0020BFF6A9|nr:NADH-quinone oxidoreductase subunit K [Altererythrobacter sp. KTW20L]MCL6251953.1 NADH-quinone oxidoreductase subunit K [Altererythrobacter sp. KTW20L]
MITSATIFGLCGAALIGLGLYGFVTQVHLLRRLLAFNVIGSGIFLLFGATAARTPTGATDPVPQALIITGIVVALAATALGVGLVLAYVRISGKACLPEDADTIDGGPHPSSHEDPPE